MTGLTENTIAVGLDNGYSNVKVCANNGRNEVIVPSVAIKIDRSDALTRNMLPMYVDETGEWMVGNDAIRFSNKTRPNTNVTKYESSEYRVHALYALAQTGVTDIQICAGCSLQNFAASRNEIQRRIMSWSGKYKNIKIRRAIVIPEPYGTYYDMTLDFRGTVVNSLDQAHVGIIDVGGNTVDLLELVNGRMTPKIVGLDEGMFRAYNDLYASLCENKKFEDAISNVYNMKRVFDKGTLLVNGEEVDVSRQIKASKKHFLTNLTRIIKDTWKTSGIEIVILTGGAAAYIEDDIRELVPHMSTPQDPVMANARGFCKYISRTQFKNEEDNK